jgi:diguanylate cyclase (GGDEF)-like protein
MNASILIVDDDEAIRDSLCALLKTSSYNAFAAPSAEAALEFLKTASVDLVLTDIKMSGMDGLQLTEQIKKNHNADVIVMTGYAGDHSYEEAIKKGANDFLFKPIRLEELRLRIMRVLNERRLTQDRDEMVEQLKELAITDGLTKLYNSRYFYNQLEIEVDRANRYGHPLSVLLLDVDNLKPHNDTYGHIEGDKVLSEFGLIIQSCLRKMDSAYRYGGDEFTVILPDTKGKEALVVAERIRVSVADKKFMPYPDKAIYLSMSIGVAELIAQEELEILIRRADQNMYISKRKGGNIVTSAFSNKPE